MTRDRLCVAMLGAGKWAEYAHIPGWIRGPRAEIVVLADVVPERAESLKQHFDLPQAASDRQEAVSRADVVGRFLFTSSAEQR